MFLAKANTGQVDANNSYFAPEELSSIEELITTIKTLTKQSDELDAMLAWNTQGKIYCHAGKKIDEETRKNVDTWFFGMPVFVVFDDKDATIPGRDETWQEYANNSGHTIEDERNGNYFTSFHLLGWDEILAFKQAGLQVVLNLGSRVDPLRPDPPQI